MQPAIDWAPALNLIGFSFSMVFTLLVFIIFALTIFGMVFKMIERNKVKKSLEQYQVKTEIQSKVSSDGVKCEICVAIAMALYSYFQDEHDNESNIITIEKVNKRYTPWSSKIYGLNMFGKRA